MPATAIDLTDLDPFIRGEDAALFRALRDADPCHWNDEGDGPGFWSLTRYADVKAVASQWETYSNLAGTQIQSRRAEGHGKPSLHNLDPPRHKQLRDVLVAELTRARVLRMEPRIREVVRTHLDRLIGVGECDLVATATLRIPVLVLATLIGAAEADAGRLAEWTNVMSGQSDPDHGADPAVVAAAREEIFAYFRGLTAARRAVPEDDLASVLAHAKLDGAPLAPDELDPYYLLLLIAGNETTRSLLTGAVLALHEHPGEWERLRAGQVGVPAAVEELVRMISPVMHMRRTTTREITLHGRAIRAGEKVVLWFAAANRDERVFTDPERLILDRAPNKHLGFGWGTHFCMGSHLAKLEAEILLAELIRRDVRVEVAGPAQRLRSNWFRGIKRLPVTVRAEQAGTGSGPGFESGEEVARADRG